MDPDHADAAMRERIEQALLGDVPQWTAAEVAERSGATLEQTRRLWRALGFPEPTEDQPMFTNSDVEALRMLNGFVASGTFSMDILLNLTRGVGQTMSRLADWEVATLTPKLDEAAAKIGGDEAAQPEATPLEQAMQVVQHIAPQFETLLLHAWRRHAAVAVGRAEALANREENTPSVELSVGFADLVSFTALTNEIGEIRIGDLVEVFESRCHDVVAKHNGRVIKSLGDSVLFVVDNAEAALDIADGIISVIGRDPRMPDVRVGLGSGGVVMRMGDVFGPPVNMAARLTTVARRNRVIIDEATAALLPPERFETRRMPARPVRGFGLVEPITVRRR
ncbi:adenylate/guanylate cyclase domain-containing protein [Nocardioides sp. Bht2]|uniref:adenylate/guanylate cyclase domain-containing protein n=1 Tax=Nocardioides sp. Bht2 TaxID=3392297 RepID=UPI0039B42311